MTLPSSLRLKKPSADINGLPSSLKLKNQPQGQAQEFTTLEEDQKEEERANAQLTSRLFESILGAPGDIASLVTGAFGKEQKILPTSKSLREFSEKSTRGYTTPKTEFEESIGDIVSDIGSMAIPGTGHYSLARNIGIPIVGSLIKEGLKYGSASEKAQAYGKVGTMIALDLLSRRSGGSKAYVDSLFQKAEETLPKGISINVSGLEKSLDKLHKTLSSGGKRPTTKKALEKIEEIRSEIKDGKIDIKHLASYRPSINEAIEELGGFQMEVPKKLKPMAIRNLNQVKSEVIDTLNQYGKKFNPEYVKLSQSANESYAAIQKSNAIANFIKDKIPYSPQSKAVQTLFSLAPVAGVGALGYISPLTAAGVAGGTALYHGFKTLYRVGKSPTLAKYYGNVLKNAAAGNVAQTTKNLKALDKSMERMENQDHPEEESSTLKMRKKQI